MILGKTQDLKVKEFSDFGAILEDSDGNTVLLPNNESSDLEIDEIIPVFIYRDSKDRLIATRKKPKIELGEFSPLEVIQTSKIGAFLDWGLDKDLLLPFAEQVARVTPGRNYLVYLYEDKTGRLAASMKVYDKLSTESPYKKGDWVEGYIYNINPEVGAFVAVDNLYNGMINKDNMNDSIHNGRTVKLRVVDVRPDGKLTLSPIKKSYKEIETNTLKIVRALKENGGFIPFNDKTSPEIIREEFDISKSAFKNALGYLLKNNFVEQTDLGIKVKKDGKN